MSKFTILALFGTIIVLVAVSATAAFFRTDASGMTQSLPAANAVVKAVELAPAAADAVPARSLYVSEQTLRARLDEAYERGSKSQVQALLRTLNGRYERRWGGLPY